jgi:hypothetical protein
MMYKYLLSQFPYLTDLGVCVSAKNIPVCDLCVLQPSAASGSVYLSKYTINRKLPQMKVTILATILQALCEQPCDRNWVTGLTSRVGAQVWCRTVPCGGAVG